MAEGILRGALAVKRGNEMTWLEILQTLAQMPAHLLEKEARMWVYDSNGDYDVLDIHDMVSPLSESEDEGDPEWREGGSFVLSLQHFKDEPKQEPKADGHGNYTLTFRKECTVMVEAASLEEATRIGDGIARCDTDRKCHELGEWYQDASDTFVGAAKEDDSWDPWLDREQALDFAGIRRTYLVDLNTMVWQSFEIEADSLDEAREKAHRLTNSREFYDEVLHDAWVKDPTVMYDLTEETQIQEVGAHEDGTHLVTDADVEHYTK